MGTVSYVLSGTVNGNDAETFNSLAKKAADASKSGEPDTLGYDWHLSEDGGSFTVVSTYKDDAAFQHHIQHMTGNGIMGEFMEKVAVDRVHVLTPVDATTRGILEGFGAVFMAKTAGRG